MTSPMASSAPWIASTPETVLAKRHLKFRGYNSKPGWFYEPFPGLYPTHHQRRQYVNAFLQWYFGDTHFDYIKTQLYQTATADVVDRFIELKREPVSPSAFEFLVDQAFWGLHFCWLPKEKQPLWPWMGVRTVPRDGIALDRFSALKTEWKGKRSLRPPQNRHEAAFPHPIILELTEDFCRIPLEHDSAEVVASSLASDDTNPVEPNDEKLVRRPPLIQATEIQGKVFPIAPPCPRSEHALWEIRYPTQTPPYGTAFLLDIPKHLDFWTYVWGPGGQDWAEITDSYVDDRVNLAWGYKHRERHPEGKALNRYGCPRLDLPDEDMFLMIGFRDVSLSDPCTLSPSRQYLITKLWKIINDWKRLCLLGKWTTLINCLQQMHEEDCTFQEVLPDNTFTFASSISQMENKASRERANECIEVIIDWIIETGVDINDFGTHLEEWVFSRKDLGLNLDERIYLAANVWRQRVPRDRYQLLIDIQAWVTSTRKMMRSEVYSSLR